MKENIFTKCIEEYDNYTKNVNRELKEYIETYIFPEYEKNDKAHGIIHIKEVIRRAFELNASLNLNLDYNVIYAIAGCHDWGKYIDHETHQKIAADKFINDEKDCVKDIVKKKQKICF